MEVPLENDAPLVTVVIPAYNAEKTLERAIVSVLQEISIPLELIVVDDGSTDSTPRLIDAAAQVDKRVRRISRPNGHVAAACNTGIRAARGKYVAFLEADDEWLPGKLQKQMDLLKARPEVQAVFCNFVNRDEVTGVRELLFDQQRRVFEALPKIELNDQAAIIDGDLRPFLVRSNFILRSSLLVGLDVLLSLGGSDEELKGDDDWDLWFRMGGAVRFAYLRQALGIRHKLSTSMSRPSPKWFEAVIKSRKKSLEMVKRTPELSSLVQPLRRQLLLLHRSLIISHNQSWEWRQSWVAFGSASKCGVDPVLWLLVATGFLGPIPFKLRRAVLSLVRGNGRQAHAAGANRRR